MIDDSWISWASNQFLEFVFLPLPNVPSEVISACGTMQGALSGSEFAVFSHFVPFSSIVGVALIFGVAGLAFVVRLTRIVISLASGGGGA